MVHDNHYVVKAQIQAEDRLLATAMAADLVLETAEDRACLRAVERLCGQAANHQTAKQNVPQEELPVVIPEPAPPSPALPEPAPPTPVVLKAVNPVPAAQESYTPNVEFSPQIYTPSLPDPAADLTLSAPEETEDILKETAPSPAPAVERLPALPIPAEGSANPAPVDLSDIIAQTDVELRRLGWTVAQGREFLERTYGKRSRHDLADQELLEFLLYLETQPSAVER